MSHLSSPPTITQLNQSLATMSLTLCHIQELIGLASPADHADPRPCHAVQLGSDEGKSLKRCTQQGNDGVQSRKRCHPNRIHPARGTSICKLISMHAPLDCMHAVQIANHAANRCTHAVQRCHGQHKSLAHAPLNCIAEAFIFGAEENISGIAEKTPGHAPRRRIDAALSETGGFRPSSSKPRTPPSHPPAPSSRGKCHK